MAITQPDLKFFLSEEVSSSATNGGAMSYDEAITGVKNNLWPNVSSAERTSGSTLLRKVFGSPQSDTDDDLVDPRLWDHNPTSGDDWIYLFAGTKTDTQATADDTRKFGSSDLKNDVIATATTIVVTVEDSSLTGIFQDADLIRLSNQSSPELSGDYEDVTISGAPGVSGDDVTITFTPALTQGFLAINTVVSSLYKPGTTSVSTGTIVVTSSSGTVDEVTYPPELNNTGTIDESLTFSFSDATNFTVVGSRSGSLASGTVSADYTAVNPTNAADLLILRNGFFGGTFAALDTVVIPTIANNIPFWLKRVVPAGAGTLSGNANTTALKGESA